MNAAIDSLTYAQYKAFQFLKTLDIEDDFILNSILKDLESKDPSLEGFEDVYVQQIWQFFESNSKAKELEVEFVEEYKKGKLTTNAFHTDYTEGVAQQMKLMTENEKTNRQKSKNIPHRVFKEQAFAEQAALVAKQKKENPVVNHTMLLKDGLEQFFTQIDKKPFDFEVFKVEYADQYQQIYEKAKNDYIQFYENLGIKDFDIEKNSASITHRAKEMSEQFYKKI